MVRARVAETDCDRVTDGGWVAGQEGTISDAGAGPWIHDTGLPLPNEFGADVALECGR